jgi:hypothetical protein
VKLKAGIGSPPAAGTISIGPKAPSPVLGTIMIDKTGKAQVTLIVTGKVDPNWTYTLQSFVFKKQ